MSERLHPVRSAAKARRARARGYNMIEVMMGLAVLAVGASGVVALQKITVLGVTSGRNLTAASVIAAAHIEALRTDAARWTTTDMTTAPLTSALFIADGEWTSPAALTGFGGLGFSDVTGHTEKDAADLAHPVAYCTQLRAVPIANSPEPEDAPILLRVEARTFWAKSGRPVTDECLPDSIPDMNDVLSGTPKAFYGVEYNVQDYGVVYLTTSVRRNDGGS